jgi:hypothetical protein
VDTTDPASIRRLAGIALVTGLSVAAAAAVLALLTGSFDDTDTRVILTSVAFALSSAVASTGAAARLRPSQTLQALGTLTVLAAVASFLLLVIGLWGDYDAGSEGLWRTFGCVAIFGIACSHACAMLGAGRRADTDSIRFLTRSAISFGAFDSLSVILLMAGIFDSVEEPWPRIFGATLVLLVLTSILPSILRRMQVRAEPATVASSTNGAGDSADEFLASAVIRIADRIDALNSDPGNRAPEINAELKRLKNLAQSFEN